MERTPINTLGELTAVINVEHLDSGKICIDNCVFNIPFGLDFFKLITNIFKDKQPFLVRDKPDKINIAFSNCVFQKDFDLLQSNQSKYELSDCTFYGNFNVSNSRFKGKLKFSRCKFQATDFYNTVFEDLADFYKCDFFQDVIFFKTDFLGTTVFSASTFHENALFTYSLIQELVIFRGTVFKKGIDLSLSIGKGKINCFDIKVNEDFKTIEPKANDKEDYESVYDRFVREDAIIPIKNKRETFRILKHTLESQNDIAESLNFKVAEKKALSKELWAKQFHTEEKNKIKRLWKWVKFKIAKSMDIFTLYMNQCSNYYGTSIWCAFWFTASVGGFFYYLSAINSGIYTFDCSLNMSTFESGFSHFIQFLLPTHSFNYMGDLKNESVWYYVFDFAGRLFVGYGIYQFIQAFRKFR